MNVTAIEERLNVDVAETGNRNCPGPHSRPQGPCRDTAFVQSHVVTIERVPATQFVDDGFEPSHGGTTLVVSGLRYVPVNEMRLMLKEEVRIGLKKTEETRVHTAEVQRQEFVVARRTGADGDWIAQPRHRPPKTVSSLCLRGWPFNLANVKPSHSWSTCHRSS
ncbi:DUF2382 domain-containing protein [Paraburkholderia sediminicola]|uniref:DUF2382 domain-containing protein n=1 Tax=Paraburkholderia sediminicola TaxID=458836 RepID=UPI0038BABB25